MSNPTATERNWNGHFWDAGEFAGDPGFAEWADLFLLMIHSFRSDTEIVLDWFAEGIKRGDKGVIIAAMMAAADWDKGSGTCPGLDVIFHAYDAEHQAGQMLREKPQP